MTAEPATFTAADTARAVAGDRAAVTAITRAFLPRVYGLALRIARDRELAEEATQETFVRAFRSLPKLREPERLTSWLLAIAANTARELARKRPRAATLEEEPEAHDAGGDARATGEDDRALRTRALERAIAKLDEDDRELFLLHTVEGVSLDDLARARGLSIAAMKSRVHRIRARLRCLALRELEAAGGVS
jgi:RNA polymerase sigma-70 factor (ECF subfamily)